MDGSSRLRDREDDMIAFTKRLVQTPSLSGEEKAIAGIVKAEMKGLGYEVSVDSMGSVVGRMGRRRGRVVLFDAHMDHIKPGGLENWAHPPYGSEVVDGVMYGRGTVDMKSSLAAMIYGCAAADVQGEVVLTAVVHEETNEGIATRRIIEELRLKPDACILGEPTDLKLSVGQRGRAVFKVTTRGATSHASMPELGRNAVYEMAPVIEAIEELNAHLPSDPFLGPGTIAVTEIRCQPGGGPIIPDLCEVFVDRRTIPGETLGGITEELRKVAVGAEVELVTDEFTCYTGVKARLPQYFAGWLTDRRHWLVRKSLKALGGVLGGEPGVIGWRFSTDGVATSGELGIPTVGFGSGDPALAHQPNEHVAVADVKAAARGFHALAEELAK
jgi:putative selenium metabolism hydrolase